MAIINGTPGDDLLNGTPGDDTITAFAGIDLLRGREGNDLLDGGDGHDNLHGNEGNDILLGGNGDEYLRGDSGDDLIDGGAGWDRVAFFTATSGITVDLRIQGMAQNTGVGFDTLSGVEHASGTEFADVILGNDGDNWLWGENGNDSISAFGGNDLVEVGPGNVSADGGSGNDTFSIWASHAAFAPVTLSLLLQGGAQATGIGTMTISGFENLSGSAGSDALTGDGADNILAGDSGNDALAGGAGNDTLYGDGRVIVDTHGTGFSGPITTYADVEADFPDGGFVDGDDMLEGGEGDDALWGGGGADTASYAGASGPVFVGLNSGFATGAGEDELHDIENALGSAHDDQLLGSNGPNVLTGGDGHDYIRAAGGNDVLSGGNGDDYLGGGSGDDLVDGGAGWDRAAFYHDTGSGVTVDLNIQGVAQDTGQGMDILIGIEHASGTAFDDVLIGNGGDNWLWGEEGNDTLLAGSGNDLVEVGTGTHVADGGAGSDTLSFYANGTGVTADVTVSLLLQGSAQATGAGSMTLTGFENLSGSYQDDILTGDGGANVLAGDVGDDILNGGDGSDTLYGDGRIIVDVHGVGTSGPITTFSDVVTACPGDPEIVSGNDILAGGKGDDTLIGGGGDDLLTGGQGRDMFRFEPGSGDDRVTDFAKKDVIAIDGVAGVDDFSDLTIVNVGGSAVISWGTGDSITLDGYKANKLSAADFSFGESAPAAAFADLWML
jgi:Ca2+-binding RTX toxin-like protein